MERQSRSSCIGGGALFFSLVESRASFPSCKSMAEKGHTVGIMLCDCHSLPPTPAIYRLLFGSGKRERSTRTVS